jgi:hypothetical protein
MELISFDEASRRLSLSRRSYLGIREIPVERIVGSVDRSVDFDRDFSPRRRLSRDRLASLRSAFPDGDVPAIDVFEVGGAYFVEDGHHRVALARERGADYIDADVTRLETDYVTKPPRVIPTDDGANPATISIGLHPLLRNLSCPCAVGSRDSHWRLYGRPPGQRLAGRSVHR